MTLVGFSIDDKTWQHIKNGTSRDVKLIDSAVYIIEKYILDNYSRDSNKMNVIITQDMIKRSREEIVKLGVK